MVTNFFFGVGELQNGRPIFRRTKGVTTRGGYYTAHRWVHERRFHFGAVFWHLFCAIVAFRARVALYLLRGDRFSSGFTFIRCGLRRWSAPFFYRHKFGGVGWCLSWC